jgi:hypothetical protein
MIRKHAVARREVIRAAGRFAIGRDVSRLLLALHNDYRVEFDQLRVLVAEYSDERGTCKALNCARIRLAELLEVKRVECDA